MIKINLYENATYLIAYANMSNYIFDHCMPDENIFNLVKLEFEKFNGVFEIGSKYIEFKTIENVTEFLLTWP